MYSPTDHKTRWLRSLWLTTAVVCLLAIIAVSIFHGSGETSSSPPAAVPDTLSKILPLGPRPVRDWPVILENSISYMLAVADIDDDGRDEIAVGVKDCRAYLIDGDGTIMPGWPQSTASWIHRGMMLADIDGDGEYEVGAGSIGGMLHMWHDDGSIVNGWPVELGGKSSSSPILVRSDGTDERSILVSDIISTVHLFAPDGRSREGWPKKLDQRTIVRHVATQDTWAADLDRNGIPEIIHMTTNPAVVHAWYLSGESFPGYPVPAGEGEGMGLAIDDPESPRHIASLTRDELSIRDLETGSVKRARPLGQQENFQSSPWFMSSGAGQDGRPDLLMSCSSAGRVYIWDLDGELIPGWPVTLTGFIYGLRLKEEKHFVYGPPIAADVDGDGGLEIILGSYDHHLYCFELDGTPVPGWPVVLDDFIIHSLALAQLDGKGAKELVVGQAGETLFAFHIDPYLPVRNTGAPGSTHTYSDWPDDYFAVSLAIILMLLLLSHLLRVELSGFSGSPRRHLRGALIFILVVLLIRALFFAGDLYRYRAARELLARAEPQVHSILKSERYKAQAVADSLAAGLRGCRAENLTDPLRALYCLEQLTDRNRLEYRFEGMLLTDRAGHVIQGVGLGRGWSDLAQLGLSDKIDTDPILLYDIPVFAVESREEVVAGNDTLRCVLLSSLLNKLPNAVADRTGFSAHVRVDGRTMAWGGAGLRPYGSMRPWLGVVQPSREIETGGAGVTVLLAKEDFERPLSQWLDLAAVLILPIIYLVIVLRRSGRERTGLSWWWLLAFGLLYVAGAVLLHRGRLETGPVPASGRALEVLLHMLGITGLVIVLHRVVTSRRSRRLNFALLGSYLIVSLIPLSVIMIIGGNIFLGIQRNIIEKTIDGLETRADNMVLAYVGNASFASNFFIKSDELLERSTERRWLNFVAENQYLFNYDYQSAYLTLWANDRNDPGKIFTGYSYRAPRTHKLYYTRPAWIDEDHIKGLFLDNGTAVIRAMRKYRYESLEADMTGHIPIDDKILTDMEERLRILSFLPRVHLEPAWLESTAERRRPEGWYFPYSSELVLQARGWYSGHPRWAVYRASLYIPSGREMLRVLVPVIFMILLPLGLSFWGAYTTFRRTISPLTRLLTGIRQVGRGDLEYRLGESGKSEIGLAAQSFDAMASNLQEMIGELAEKQKVEEVSEMKSDFISMVSHDLKTPLASIRGAAENVLEEVTGPVNERQRTYLEMILKSSGDLQRMITDLLDLSRIESGRLRLNIEPLDIKREAQDLLHSIEPILEKEGMTGRMTVSAESTIVRGDRVRIWQILNNIVSNAVRHSPEEGTIEIRIADIPIDETNGRRMVRISVRDEGPGISEEGAAQLFEPFFYRSSAQTGAHGAGLGLAIVKTLVELHGGSVSIRNSAAGGAVFSFTLPA